jgi:hypothetical protein
VTKTLHSLSQEEERESDPLESTSGEISETVKSMSDTARRLMQLKLVKRQSTLSVRPDANNPVGTLHLNAFLQALLDRSVQQIYHSLGQSASWSQLAPSIQPLSQSQLIELYDSSGRVQNVQLLQLYVFRHGVQASARPQVWKHLLQVYPPEANWNERIELDETHQTLYEQMRSEWQTHFRHSKVQQVYQQVGLL